MHDEIPWYVSLAMSWLPFLMLMGMGIWVTLTVRAAWRTRDGRSLAQAFDDLGRELRRSNELLAEAVKGERRGPDAGGRKP